MTQVNKDTEAKVRELVERVSAKEITFEEALRAMILRDPAPRVDLIGRAKSATALTDLADLYKKAAAKMSSAKRRAGDNYFEDAAYLRYKAEFKAIKARKNELYASVADLEDEVEAAIKMGAKTQAIVQTFMNQEKKLLEDEVLKIKARKKLTNQELAMELKKSSSKPTKEMLAKLEGYQEGLSQAYLSRNENDQFVIKLNQMSNYIKSQNKTSRKEVK